MPTIHFRILATDEQTAAIEQDFRALMNALGDDLTAELSIAGGQTPDPELITTWVEVFGDDDAPATGTTIDVAVAEYRIGSISGLTMHFAELLTTREKEPAEPLLRQVRDDAGTPRVPWHVEVRP